MPEDQRRALKGLLDAALQRSDAGSIVPRPLPSETMVMLMLVHLKAETNELEEGRESSWREKQLILNRNRCGCGGIRVHMGLSPRPKW